MSTLSRRIGAVALTAALVAGVSACSSSSGSSSDEPSGDKSIILITPTAVGSNNFLKLAVEGAKAAGKANGAKVDVYESKDPASIHSLANEHDATDCCLERARPGDIVVLTPTDIEGVWARVQAYADAGVTIPVMALLPTPELERGGLPALTELITALGR